MHRHEKKGYTTREDALLAADRVALWEWEHGLDKKLRAFWCDHHRCWHVGMVTQRPVQSFLAALHEYTYLTSPQAHSLEPTDEETQHSSTLGQAG
jgi:hypothetical protein